MVNQKPLNESFQGAINGGWHQNTSRVFFFHSKHKYQFIRIQIFNKGFVQLHYFFFAFSSGVGFPDKDETTAGMSGLCG
jgi:hypothetical protein